MFDRKRIIFALFIFIGMTIASLIVTFWFADAATVIQPEKRLLAPSIEHWFGTDDFGRDLFTRTLLAAKVSIFIGGVVALLSTVIGMIIGLLSGYYEKADFLIMRVIDGFLAFPSLLLALALVAALGGSLTNIIIALTFTFSPFMARIVRSSVLQIKNMPYIEAAKVTGVGDFVIMFRYILPNVLTPIIVQGTFVFAKAILAEAALSFLGVGMDPTVASWGSMLEEAQIYMTIAPWTSIFPGLAIVITVFSLNILGDGARKMLDPHAVRRRKRRNFFRKPKPVEV